MQAEKITEKTHNKLKANKLILIAATLAALFSPRAGAQVQWADAFSKFKLEARADADFTHHGDSLLDDAYGFRGRYFNLMVGGNLGNGFSYYFRQRLKAEPGSIAFFDNTDFLYLNYRPSQNWQLRFGKDAMAFGGFEYDAPPIDVYFNAEYWDNFYCFQLGLGGSYITDDGLHTFTAQVTTSPYVGTYGLGWDAGLLSYNLMWTGTLGPVHTLWSVNMMQRDRDHWTGMIALGTQLVQERWNWYIDLLHHSLTTDDWMKNFGIVSRFNVLISNRWTFFVKGSYEQNRSEADLVYAGSPSVAYTLDGMVMPNHAYFHTGLGCEYHPTDNVRLHAYVAYRDDCEFDAVNNGVTTTDQHTASLTASAGATWTLDFHKMFKK